MKILAIRGRNLASLYGDFEVDLAAEPFASAGLFAITGATGAGKSTLLDALCLALYNSTPRLAKSGGPLVGRADQEEALRLAAHDVRGLLSRGQGSGFAEVDFASRNGERWRARWEVHRARERADGRLQQQTLLLEHLASGKLIGGNNTEVLQAIRQHVGLSFDQFRRSVLLAQGDFAAFLHAESTERASLLEKVTGTAIYTRLSKATFARAKEERTALDDLAQQHLHLGLLSVEDRRIAEQEQATAAAALHTARQTLEAAEEATRWYLQRTALLAREEEGRSAHAAAAARWEGTTERRNTLQLIKAAQPLRSLVEQQEKATSRRDETRHQVEYNSDLLLAAREAMATATTKLHQARAAEEQAKRDVEARAPDLDRATELDFSLRQAEVAAEEAKTRATAAAGQAHEATERAAAAAREVGDQIAIREAANRWMQKHPGARALHGVWNHVQAALGEVHQAHRAVTAAKEEHPALAMEASQAATATELAATHLDTAEHHLESCQRAVENAEAAIPQGRQEELDVERKLCTSRLQALHSAEEAHGAARRAQQEQRRAEQGAEESHKRQQTALTAVERDRTALREQKIRLDEAEHALRASQAILDLEERRAELVEGEACPLCGATSHPFHHRGAPQGVLAEQQQRVHLLREQNAQLTADLATAEEQVKTSRNEFEERTRQAADAAAALAAPRQIWAQTLDTLRGLGPPSIDLPEDPLADGATTALLDARAQSEQASQQHQLREEEFRLLQRQAQDHRNARDSARRERDAYLKARESAQEKVVQTTAALAMAERRLAEETSRLEAARKSLETSLGDRPDWREQLAADSDAFLRACQTEVRDFNQQSAALAQAEAALTQMQPEAAKTAAEAEAARYTAKDREEQRQRHLATVEALRHERGTVLDGQPVATVKRTLLEASTEAGRLLDAALRLERDAGAALRAAETRLEGSRAQLGKESTALEATERALQEALVEHRLDLETLRQRLHHDLAWCDQEAHVLQEIQQAGQTTASILAERQELREAHERTHPPEVSESEATALRQSATEALRRAEELAQDRLLQIKRDDGARARGEVLATAMAQQEIISTRWATLNEVIGSSNGDKFRKFAQGLTLDALLGYANVHLRDLAPRYHLDRVPGEDLELQVVDLDMGDEVRSINSLSGGETFLASLALALGLSSLSASDTPVDSLFIDEGFGTLDLQTLEVALSALDTLQASGRQVGMISHVQEMGQRLGVQVRVVKLGAGRSRIEVTRGR